MINFELFMRRVNISYSVHFFLRDINKYQLYFTICFFITKDDIEEIGNDQFFLIINNKLLIKIPPIFNHRANELHCVSIRDITLNYINYTITNFTIFIMKKIFKKLINS